MICNCYFVQGLGQVAKVNKKVLKVSKNQIQKEGRERTLKQVLFQGRGLHSS